MPYPLGIADVPVASMIDIDEARIIMANTNQSFAKTMVGRRARLIQHYSRDNSGRLLLAAIAGNAGGDRWLTAYEDGGTSIQRFVAFIQQILNDIGPGVPGNRRCFMMDNLSAHHDALVQQMINNAGHYLVYRAPYWPQDGPIEYFFNYVEGILMTERYEIHTPAQLEGHINHIFATTTNFVNWFNHCGFVL